MPQQKNLEDISQTVILQVKENMSEFNLKHKRWNQVIQWLYGCKLKYSVT